MTDLGPIELNRRTGAEKFSDGTDTLDFDLLSFWQWSSSDIVSNVTRGILAEYIVAQALCVAENQIREEWAAFDLQTASGIKVEVKSSAYIQSWHQDQYTRISFRVPKTLEWIKETSRQSTHATRQADVYVFALLAEFNQERLNPLDVSQWEFYILSTSVLNKRKRSQHSITLPSLKKLTQSLKFNELRTAIEKASRDN